MNVLSPGEVGKVDEDLLHGIELHTEALGLYRAGKFPDAVRLFLDASAALGDNEAARKLADRCKLYVVQKPPLGWNGSFHMAEK